MSTWTEPSPLSVIESDVSAMFAGSWIGRLFAWLERHGIR